MARTKTTSTVQISEDVQLADDLATNLNTMSALQSEYNEGRDLVNQLLGQVQMASAISRFSDVVGLTKLQYIKENKLYQHLKGKKSTAPDGSEISDVGTFEGFCKALGLSYSKVHEDLTNLNAFGEEALKQLSAVGAGYRELRQYRKLPEDQQSALIEVAKEGDKNALLDLAEEMIAKHAKEKEALTKELNDTKTDLDINRQTLQEKKEEISAKREEVEQLEIKLRQRVARERPDEEGAMLVQELSTLRFAAVADLQSLENGFTLLAEHTERTGIDHTAVMTGMIDDIAQKLHALRTSFNLPEHDLHDPRPDWTRDDTQEDEENLLPPHLRGHAASHHEG
ncbi:MAG: hypothetical protein RSE33_12215 [Hafnia sp.]